MSQKKLIKRFFIFIELSLCVQSEINFLIIFMIYIFLPLSELFKRAIRLILIWLIFYIQFSFELADTIGSEKSVR